MCTVTWIRSCGGWELFANRDEQRTRLPAEPPRVFYRDGLCVIAPTDADAGGTWIGANECGLGLCLLNGPVGDEAEATDAFTSRGLLVREVLGARTLAAVAARLQGTELARTRRFSLLGLSLEEPTALHVWDGHTLSVRIGPNLPLVSSSRDTEQARRHRERVWRRLHPEGRAPTAESLAAFHRSHEPEPGPWSVCMHREEARTVSASHVRVGPGGRVEFHYAPGPPCRTGWNAPVVLDGIRSGRA